MRKIREILRLTLGEGLSRRVVAAATGLPYTTVADHLVRAAAAGIGWPLPDDLDDAQLEARLFARAEPPPAASRPLPDWPTVHRELRRKGVTLQLLHMEYKEREPSGYQSSIAWRGLPALQRGPARVPAAPGRGGREAQPWAGPLLERGEGLILAAGGDLAGAERLLEHSADELRSAPAPLETGRALLVLGTVRRKARRYAAARGSLGEAQELFDRLGAALWAERAREQLARIPGRRGGDIQTLTASETTIATLVAHGRSNKEVAAELFVSVKTVEATLTHVFQKVGVRSRAELAARFAGTSLAEDRT